MSININNKVKECLVASGRRMTARNIADWIFATYPDECEEKRRSSKQDLTSDALLIQQLVAEIGASREAIEKKWKEVRTTSDRPRLYFWTEVTDAAEVANAEGVPDTSPASESFTPKKNTIFTQFLVLFFGLNGAFIRNALMKKLLRIGRARVEIDGYFLIL